MARRRRGDSDVPITLFSFQDIITCVTGIMLLVVLLLILETLEARVSAAATARPELAADLARLQARLASSRRQLEEEKDWRARNQALVEEILATRSEAVPAKLQEERRQQESLLRQSATAEAAAAALERQLQTALEKGKAARADAETLAQRKKQLEEAVAERRAELAAVEEQAKAAKLRGKLVKFSVSRAEKAKTLLVECSLNGLAIQALSPGAPVERLYDDSNNFLGALRRFDRWLASRDPGSCYVVLLVKPSAAGYVLNVADQLRQRGFQFGMEPLEEDRTGMQANE